MQNSDHSLAITRLKEEDSGTYTCMAETDLDFDEAKAILIVQDVPNPPFLQWVTCRPTDADVVWRPSENNKAPITSFTIERSTSFAPDQWDKATGMPHVILITKYFLFRFLILEENLLLLSLVLL